MTTAETITPAAADRIACVDEARRISRILDVATFCGFQEDGRGGRIELWTLIKPLGRHPARSTLARSTLNRLLGL